MDTNFVRAFATAGAMMWACAGQSFAEDSLITASINDGAPVTIPYDEGRILEDDKFIRFGKITKRVAGHVEFCKNFSTACADRSEGYEIVSAKMIPLVRAINDQVNFDILPMTDMDFYQEEELWTYPPRFGDCEDYALEKRRDLIASGIPASALSLALVYKPKDDGNGFEGHAVLIVRTEIGDLILDNLTKKLRLPSMTNYDFIKATTFEDSAEWRDISAAGTMKYTLRLPEHRPDIEPASPR